MEFAVNEEADLRISDIAALIRHARKSASYKPALLKALVRYCQCREFTKLYGNSDSL